MPAARIICPGCKTILTSIPVPDPGKVVDCPHCQLLFVPTEADLAIAAPNPSPFSPRRRRSRKRTELGPVVIACTVLFILAGGFIGSYLFYLSRSVPPPHPVTATSPAATTADVPSPSSVPEVEDDRPPPRKPVPSLDDDPPGKLVPPRAADTK